MKSGIVVKIASVQLLWYKSLGSCTFILCHNLYFQEILCTFNNIVLDLLVFIG